MMELRRKLADSERWCLLEMGHVLTVDEIQHMARWIVRVIHKETEDTEDLRRIHRRISGVLQERERRRY